ncbi:MAG: hypothetical protein K2G52_02060 [Muribaculaceae bacterium]|nr:hypothetical protein [Muribaculaceae bacterium]
MMNFDYLKDIPELSALYRYCDVDEDSIFPGKFHKVGEFVSLLHNAITAA